MSALFFSWLRTISSTMEPEEKKHGIIQQGSERVFVIAGLWMPLDIC